MSKKVKYDKNKFYSLDKIFKACPLAKYYIITGERSNGKTFAVLEYGIRNYVEGKGCIAILRRLEENFKGKNGEEMFSNFLENTTRGNVIAELTNGRWNSITYHARRWTLCNRDEDHTIAERDSIPFCYGFAIGSSEKYKGTSYPRITTILNDEFISESDSYLTNEFMKFVSVLSSIVRERDNVRIFLCANAIPSYNPYIREMGITHWKTQEKGTIDIYTYSDPRLFVACERTDTASKTGGKKSDVLFAFDNPKLKMLTQGDFAFNIYPHLPFEYEENEIRYMYFISFDGDVFQCEIINHKGQWITYIHKKTTPIKDDGRHLVYQEEFDPRRNYARRLLHPTNQVQKAIASYFVREKVFYQDNSVGEAINLYLNWQDSL